MKTTCSTPKRNYRAWSLFFAAALAAGAAFTAAAPARAQDLPGGPGPEMDAGEAPPPPHRMQQNRRQMMERWLERQEGEPGQGGPGMKGGRGPGAFLRMVQDFQQAVQDPYQAVGLAVLSIKDHYRREKKPAEAVVFFESLLKETTDQKLRNIFLFSLRQIHEEQKDPAKVLEVSKKILEENLRAIKGAR
jgi:hypothetical protein